jgi:hypothetical protein
MAWGPLIPLLEWPSRHRSRLSSVVACALRIQCRPPSRRDGLGAGIFAWRSEGGPGSPGSLRGGARERPDLRMLVRGTGEGRCSWRRWPTT